MGSLTIEDDSGKSYRLVKMRNPWGSNNEKYRGKWSDQSSVWTDDLRSQAGHLNANDGEFFMEFDDYL